MTKRIGQNHETALRLWESGIHEARILASMVEEHQKVSDEQMEVWAAKFDSWDLTDQCCIG